MHKPRILWIGMDDNQFIVKKIVDQIEETFGVIGFAKEKRAFSAHITIGRIRSLKNIKELLLVMQEISVPNNCIQPIDKVTLYKSTLTDQGPIYEPLHTTQLELT